MSPSFIPDPPAPELPQKLQSMIDDSVRRFEGRFGIVWLSFARQNGWIADYKTEITALVRAALENK